MELLVYIMASASKDTAIVKKWKSLYAPASFSSAEALSRHVAGSNWRGQVENITKGLKHSVLFQAHRDLKQKFPRRNDVATRYGQRIQADLGDFGAAIPPAFSQLPFIKKRKQLFFLVGIDVFSRRIFARGLKGKTSSEVTSQFSNIIQGLRPPWKSPEVVTTDAGTEFTGSAFQDYLRKIGARHDIARNFSHAEMSERAIKSLKRIIFAAVQTGTWPKYQTWDAIVQAAADSLNGRYNRSIGMAPNDVPSHYGELLAKERERLDLVPHEQLIADEKKLAKGESISEDNRQWKIGTLVLVPRLKSRGLPRKEFYMRYDLQFREISKIFHERRPYLYAVRNAHTKTQDKRLYYAKEMKQIELAPAIVPSEVVDYRIKPGTGLQYKLESGEWKKTL